MANRLPALRRVLKHIQARQKVFQYQLTNGVENDGRRDIGEVDGPNNKGSWIQVKKFRHSP